MPAYQFLWATCLFSSLLYRGKPSNDNNEKQESLGNLMEGKHDDMKLSKTQSDAKMTDF